MKTVNKMEKEKWEFEAACKTVSLADLRKLIEENSEAVAAYEVLIDELKETLGKLVFQLGDLMEAAAEQGIAEVVDDVEGETADE